MKVLIKNYIDVGGISFEARKEVEKLHSYKDKLRDFFKPDLEKIEEIFIPITEGNSRVEIVQYMDNGTFSVS